MPSKQEVEIYEFHETGNRVTASVEPVDHPSPIYYTDEAPEFEVTVTNGLEADVDEDSEIAWYMASDAGAVIQEGRIQTPLDSGESGTYVIGGENLAHEGHATISFDMAGVRNPSGPEASLSPGRSHSPSGNPAYSFRIHDRETYERTHRKPLRYQKVTIALSVIIILVGLIQLYFTLVP